LGNFILKLNAFILPSKNYRGKNNGTPHAEKAKLRTNK